MTCHYGGRGSEGSKLHPCTRLVAPLGLGSESSIIAPRALCTLFAQFSFFVALPNQPTNRRWVIFWTLLLVRWWVGLVLSKLGHPAVMQVMFAVVVLKLAFRWDAQRRFQLHWLLSFNLLSIVYAPMLFVNISTAVRSCYSLNCFLFCCSCLLIFIVTFGYLLS